MQLDGQTPASPTPTAKRTYRTPMARPTPKASAPVALTQSRVPMARALAAKRVGLKPGG